jgi:hypothetical protein
MIKKLTVRMVNNALRVSAIFTILVPVCIGFQNTYAGNVMLSGTKVKIFPETFSVSVSNFVIKNGATLNNGGMLVLNKGLTNENSVPSSLGTGTVKLMGTTSQTVTGQNTIQNLIINNTSGVTIAGNTTINGTLTLTSGKVLLGNYNLLLGPAGNISGTPSAARMIIVTATGELRKNFPSGFTGSFTFPVGDNTGTAEYSPVKLNITGGTFATVNYIGVSLRNYKHPDPLITGNYLKRYWSISKSGINGLSCNAVFQYVPADVVGNENIIRCMRITPVPVIPYALANTVTHQLIANGITSFGTYTGSSQSGASLSGPTQVCVNSTGNVYVTEAGQTNYVWVVSAGGIITEGGTNTSNTVTISWNTAGPQSVSVNYNGSANPLVLNVTVNPLPVPVLNGPSSACTDNITTYYTDPGQSNYIWSVSPGGTIIEGVGSCSNTVMVKWISRGSQAVSVSYTNCFGCTPAVPSVKNVTVNPAPVPVITGPGTVNSNMTCQYFTTTGMSNYSWTVSSGGTIISGGGPANSWVDILWSETGSQTVSVNFANTYGCSAPEPGTLSVFVNPPAMLPESDPTANNENNLLKNLYDASNKDLFPEFSVYPVPNNGRFTISVTSPYTENYAISIVNYLGAEVYNQKNLIADGVQKQPIDISSVSEGVYMVIIRSAENQAVRRILIRK